MKLFALCLVLPAVAFGVTVGTLPQAERAEAAAPGVVEARWANGETKWTTSGFADIEAGRPAATNDLFWIASNTKGVAAALVLTFVDEGKIGLDDPVARHFPEWSGICVVKDGRRRPASVEPTVRMLLSHQAGLDFFPGMPIDRYSVRELVTEAVRRGLIHEPGSRWKYSNWGIDVAVAIAEKVGGKPWETLLRERILDPLGMKDTCFWPTDEQLRRLEVPYFLGKDGRSAPVRIGTVNQFREPYGDRTRRAEAGGGLFSTVPDMLAFAQMVAQGGVGVNGRRILSEAICEEWYKVQTRPDEPGLKKDRRYSFGMDVDPAKGTICHGGAYGTHVAVNWKKRSCRVTFVQRAKNAPKDRELIVESERIEK